MVTTSKNMEIALNIVGLVLIVIGVCFGLYVGGYVCFIGGIVDFIDEIKAPVTESMNVALAIAKVFGAGFAGIVSAVVFVLPGSVLLKDR